MITRLYTIYLIFVVKVNGFVRILPNSSLNRNIQVCAIVILDLVSVKVKVFQESKIPHNRKILSLFLLRSHKNQNAYKLSIWIIVWGICKLVRSEFKAPFNKTFHEEVFYLAKCISPLLTLTPGARRMWCTFDSLIMIDYSPGYHHTNGTVRRQKVDKDGRYNKAKEKKLNIVKEEKTQVAALGRESKPNVNW